jgi:predicted RNA-binding Zn ribbon-like protein
MKALRLRLPRQVVAAEQAAAAGYQRPAWLAGDVAGIVADLLALVAPQLRRVGKQPRDGHWHLAAAELTAYRMTVSEIGIIRRSPRTLREQARLIDALLAGAQSAVEQIQVQARAEYDAACAAELAAAAVAVAAPPADDPPAGLPVVDGTAPDLAPVVAAAVVVPGDELVAS